MGSATILEADLCSDRPHSGMGHRRNVLVSLDHFSEGLAVGIFTDEAWIENVSRVAR
jgi:hypothetical protein